MSTQCPVRFHHTHAAPFLLCHPPHREKKKRETFAPIFLLLSFRHNQSSPQSNNSSRLSSKPSRKQTHRKKDTTDCTKSSSKLCYRQKREQQEPKIKHKWRNSSKHKHASSAEILVVWVDNCTINRGRTATMLRRHDSRGTTLGFRIRVGRRLAWCKEQEDQLRVYLGFRVGRQVLKVFPPSSLRVPYNVLNSTSFLSHIVWLWFKFHVFIYNILGFDRFWSSFPSCRHPSCHPSIQVPHPGRRWWKRRTTTNGGRSSLWKTPVVLQFAKSYKLISKN